MWKIKINKITCLFYVPFAVFLFTALVMNSFAGKNRYLLSVIPVFDCAKFRSQTFQQTFKIE